MNPILAQYIASKIMIDIFVITELLYSLRHETKFKSKKIKTVRFGIETSGIFRTQSNIYDGAFLLKLLAVNDFRKKLHRKCMTGF